MEYSEFLKSKEIKRKAEGFEPLWMPDVLFYFQSHLTDYAIRSGRCAIYAECGLGKSVMELVWAENIVRKTNKNVLLLTPLAVAPQMIREADKFGIKARKVRGGAVRPGINVTNYQQLHHYNPKDFIAVVADESSCIKNADAATRKDLTEFLHQIPYRLLCTATPAPNDFMELGTSSEALGVMPRNQMLGMFFTNDGETTQQWRLKGHAKKRFWQWVASWARAIRKPSDLGFDDRKFILPELQMVQHKIQSDRGYGFLPRVARTLSEQLAEKRTTVQRRCEKVAEVLSMAEGISLAWCQLNTEGDLLTKLLPDAVQVCGSDSDDYKEEMLTAFSDGQIKTLVTKSSIAGFGLNWQVCNEVAYFPTHSHEAFYQAIRRCWRFGQKKPVKCHLVYTEAQSRVLSNMLRKEQQSEELYRGIVRHMQEAGQQKQEETNGHTKVSLPLWLK